MKLSRTLAAVAAVVGVSACASGPDVAQPDAMLIDNANNFYSRGRYSQAVDYYRKSVEQNPDSPFRKGAAIGLADALYREKEFFEAALYYERFTELYPLDPITPRAYFYKAMCHYNDVRSPDRDQTNTRKAKEAFENFIRKYPNHVLATLAKKHIGEMDAHLIDSEMDVIRYYHRANRNQGAIWRIRDHLQKHPASPHIEEALFIMGECYYREQAYKEAASTFITLIERNPKSEFAAKAAALAKEIKLKAD